MLEDKGHPTTVRCFCINIKKKKKNYCEAGVYNILEMKYASLCICAYGFVRQPKF